MKKIKGFSINPGKVIAKACLYSAQKHDIVLKRQISDEAEVQDEIIRFESAVKICSDELDLVAQNVKEEIGASEAEIFIAQKHIMNDPVILREIENRVLHSKVNIEYALNEVLKSYENKFADLDDEYIKERASDIGEIRRRLLNQLLHNHPKFKCEGQSHCTRGKKRIIVAEHLSTDMMLHLDLEKVYGIATEHGGKTSHAAIIARSVGLPTVSGARGIFSDADCGDSIFIDGDSGEVYLKPDSRTVLAMMPEREVQKEEPKIIETPEGMEVLANASLIEDVRHAVNNYADGIGLFRTELSFFRAQRLLTQDEQFDEYSDILRCMNGRPVTFRLLDVGGDKKLPFLKEKDTGNHSLELRGLRFLLANKEILSAQMKALLKLSNTGKIRVLFPMIIDLSQVKEILKYINGLINTMEVNIDNIKFGVMFEVPSACFQAKQILRLVDFGCIGSNDLIQYLFAIERDNELVLEDPCQTHQVLWSIMKNIQKIARSLGKPLTICGEMAGKQEMISRFLEIGITSLSVSPRLVSDVRNEMHKYKTNK
ncbi:MAG: phosphoenolpyruvate--protein phosphotransferase [Chitinispirillia bacterium]|jgi:phosphotransferase system enzyme I (PtsI)